MIPVALLCVVAITHLGDSIISSAFGLDRAWVFYVLRGLEGVFLYGLLVRVSPWVAAVATWGAIESALTSICGSLSMIDGAAAASPMGLCSAKTGMPVAYYGSLITASLLACSLAFRRPRHGGT